MTANQSTIWIFCAFILAVLCQACQKEKLTEISGFQMEKLNDLQLNDILFTNDTIGFIVGGQRYVHGTIIRTLDGGITWDSLQYNVGKMYYDINVSNESQMMIAVEDSKVMTSGHQGLLWGLHQYNTRPSWMPLHEAERVGFYHSIIVGGFGNETGGMIRTRNGFETAALDSFEFELRGVEMIDTITAYAVGYGTIMKTENLGDQWTIQNAEGDFFIDLHFFDEEEGIVIGQHGSILKTEDGETWNYIRKGNQLLQEQVRFTSLFFMDELNGYITGENGLFWGTEDGGNSWNKYNLETSINLRAASASGEELFIVGDDGLLIRLPLDF